MPHPFSLKLKFGKARIIFCTFVIARGDPSVLFHPVNQSLHTLTQTIDGSIKGTTSMFILLVGNGDADATAPPMPPNAAAAIGLVAHHTTRPLFGTASATAFDGTTRQECLKLDGFVTLARRQHKRHQLFVACRA